MNNKRLTGSERRKVWDEVRELRKELKQRERGLFTDTLHDANVVLSTLHGAAGGVLERAMRRSSPAAEGDAPEKKSRRFDTIVIDEACQAIEASTWGAVLDTFEEGKGARLILAGDDKQLGPVVKSESGLPGKKTKKKGEGKDKGKKASVKKEKEDEAEGAIDLAEKAKESLKVDDAADAAATAAHAPAEDEEQEDNSDHDDNDNAAEGASVITKPRQGRPSRLLPPRSLTQTLFTRLLRTYGLGSSIKSLLTVQYRMNEVIMEFPNKEMYGGKLVAHDSCKDRWVGDGGVAGGWTVEKGEGMDVVEGEGLVGGRVVFYDTAGAESELCNGTRTPGLVSPLTYTIVFLAQCTSHQMMTIPPRPSRVAPSPIPTRSKSFVLTFPSSARRTSSHPLQSPSWRPTRRKSAPSAPLFPPPTGPVWKSAPSTRCKDASRMWSSFRSYVAPRSNEGSKARQIA